MEEKGMVKYDARDGQEITLSFDLVRRYLVQGNRDLVTEQELMYFLAICKSRGLNPFKRDAYLIKYGGDPAAIVTSIDYFRSRARAQKDCRGWKKGIIVQKPDGSLRYSEGLILDDERLLGGWFEAVPDGWTVPFKLEVNLKGYIKHTKEGKITRFWSEENQPSQIMKVVESQGLRTVWPDEFSKMYTDAEVRVDSEAPLLIDIEPEPKGEKKAAFVLPSGIDPARVEEFVKAIAESQGNTADEIKKAASQNMDVFVQNYQRWEEALKKTEPTYAFINLKAKGWTDYYDKVTEEDFNRWTKEAQETFIRKCRVMTEKAGLSTPWPKPTPTPTEIVEPEPTSQASSPVTSWLERLAEATEVVEQDVYLRACSDVGIEKVMNEQDAEKVLKRINEIVDQG